MAVPRSATRHHSRWLPDAPAPSSAPETFFCHSIGDCEVYAGLPATAAPPEASVVLSPHVDGDLSVNAAVSCHTATDTACISVNAAQSRHSSKESNGMYSKSLWRTQRVLSQFDIDKTSRAPPPANYTPANEQVGTRADKKTSQPKDHLGNDSSVEKSKCKSLGQNSCASHRPRSRSCSAQRSVLSERWEGGGESSTAADARSAREGRSHESCTTTPTTLCRIGSCSGNPAVKSYEITPLSRRRERSTTAPTEYIAEEEMSVFFPRRQGENTVLSLTVQKEADFSLHRQRGNTKTSSSIALKEGTEARHHPDEARAKQKEQLKTAKEKTWSESVEKVDRSENEVTSCPTSGDNLGQDTWRQETPGLQNAHEAKSYFVYSCIDTYPEHSIATEHRGRPIRDAETVKSRSASFSFIANGASRKCDCRSGVIPRGRPTATVVAAKAAAATAAAANFERQAGETSCRTSRLARDFTDIVVVGKGGCGRVLKARHLLDGRVYAIKEIKFAATTRHLQSRMQLFLREVQCLRRLDCNENIVRYFSSWIEVNPLSKASVPSHDDQGSAADHPATDILPQALEEEASAVEDARQEEEDPESQPIADCCTPTRRIPFREKGRSDECLSFYSVSHSQTTRHSDRIDKGAAAQGDTQAAGLHRKCSREDAAVIGGRRLQSYQNELISPALTFVEGTRKNLRKATQPSPCSLNTRCHSEPCEAATTSRRPGAHDGTAGWTPMAERRHIVEHGDPRIRCCFSGKGERQGCTASKDACRACFFPTATGLQSDRAVGEVISRAAVNRQDEDAVMPLRSIPGSDCSLFTPDRQGNGRAASMPARTADASESEDFICSAAEHKSYFPSPVHLRLPRISDMNKGNASGLVLEDDSTYRGGRLCSKKSFTRVSTVRSIQSKFELEAPREEQDEEGESEHAAGPQGKLWQLRPGDPEAATSKKETYSLSLPDANQTDTNDYIEDLSPALRLALARRRLSHSSANFYLQKTFCHTRGGAGPRVFSACRPSSSISPVSLSLPSFRYEPCNNSDCAGDALHSGCGSIADDKYGCHSCEEEPYEDGDAGRLMPVLQSSTSSGRESSQTPNCFSTEEKRSTDGVSSTVHGWKYHNHSMNEAGGAAACSPLPVNSSMATTIGQETARASRMYLSNPRFDVSSDAEGESAQAGEKAMFHSAISVEDRHDWSMSTGQEEQQRGDVLFVPVPLSEPGVPRQSVQDNDFSADSKKKNPNSCFQESQNSCFQRKGAISGTSAAEQDGSNSVTPAFVALDDFWCCEDFGAQAQPGGLEIVFAEEASPTIQKDKKDEHDRSDAVEEVHHKHSTLTETPVAATSDPSSTSGLSSTNIPGSVAGDERNACVGSTLSLISAEQEASAHQTKAVQPREEACTNSETSAISILVQEGPQPYSPCPAVSTEAHRASHDTGRDGLNAGNACVIDAASGDGGEVLARSAPPGVAAAGQGETTEFSANKKGGIRLSEAGERAEQIINIRSQASLPMIQHAGAQQVESEGGQEQEQVDQQQHRWREDQQAERQPHPQKPMEQQQHHQTDASRPAGYAGTKSKPGSATRVEVSLYIQMEYCSMSLDEYIAQTPEIDPDRNEEIMAMIVNGLYSCHSAGIMHRDLKPSNIFIKGGGTVKLGDFGLAFSEDMDDDVWNSALSASPASAKCLRDGLGGSRLHPTSSFCRDNNPRLSPFLAPEPPTKVLTPGTLLKRHEQSDVRSAVATSSGGNIQQKDFHALESSPQEPAQHIKGEHLREDALSHKKGVLHSPLHTGDFLGRPDAGISADCASEKTDTCVGMRSRVFPAACSDHVRRAKCGTCGQQQQHVATSLSSPSGQREAGKNEEVCMTQLPLKTGYSLPVFRCTTLAAPVIMRVHSEEALRHVTCAAGRHVPRKMVDFDEIEDLRFQNRERTYCCPSQMRCWPASAQHLLERRCCLRYCHNSNGQTLRPGIFSCELAAAACGCPLDVPAPVLAEIKTVRTGTDASRHRISSSRRSCEGGESKQQEQSGRGKHKVADAVASKTVQRAASKAFTQEDDTRVKMQHQISSRSEDREHSGKLLPREYASRRHLSPATGTSPCCARDDMPTSTGGPPEPMLCHSDTGNNATGVTPSTVAHPVVVVQPPPLSSSPVSALTEHNDYTSTSPQYLLPVKGGTLYVHSAEDGDRSGGSGGNRHSSELNSGSAGISSPPGSHASPALSVLASPVFTNRTTGVGTSAYAPPEQLKGGQYDYSVDIWSLGLIAIDLFTRCETAMERAMNFRNAREGRLPPSICLHYPWVVPFCLWCLQRDPLQRPTIKQLYTHQCLTGSVFTRRSVLSSPIPVVHAFQLPPICLRSADLQPGTVVDGKDETDIETAADHTRRFSAASSATTQPDTFALASAAQHEVVNVYIPTAGRDQHQQLHLLCGKCGFCVSPAMAYEGSCKAPRDDQYLGALEFGSRNANSFDALACNDTKRLNQLWESESAGDVNLGTAKGMRRGSTSPALVTPSSKHLPHFRRSTSPWPNGDNEESLLWAGRRGMMHKPVPLSALTLGGGLAFQATSGAIRCIPSVSLRRPPNPTRLLQRRDSNEPIQRQSHLSLGASLDESHDASRGSREDGRGTEVLRENTPQLNTKHHAHLSPIKNQAESKESHPSDNDADLLPAVPFAKAAQTRRKRVSVESSVSVSKMSSFPVSRTDGKRASTTMDDDVLTAATTPSTTTNVTAKGRSPCPPAGEEEDMATVSCSEKWSAGIGKKEAWNREACHKEWTAENNGRVTSPVEGSSTSTDAFIGTGLTLDGQCASLRSGDGFCEQTSETNSNFYFCTQVYSHQHAAEAVALRVCPIDDGTGDNAYWETRANGLTRRPDRAIQREQTGGTSDTIKKEMLCATARSLARPRHFPVGPPATGDDSTVGENRGETFTSALKAGESGQRAERTCWSQMNESQYQPNNLQPTGAKGTNGESDIEARRITRTKSAEDFIHSAVKRYAQKMLNRYCELSSKHTRSHDGRRASPALPPVPRLKECGSSGGMRRRSNLLESQVHRSAVEVVRIPGEVKQDHVENLQQRAQHQGVQYPRHRREDKGELYRQKKWYSFEENVPSVPTLCGIMHLRGFLPVPSRSAEPQPLVESCALRRRAEIFVRSRRGEWKTRFAAVDKEKKLVYIFSDRNDSTKAKRVIQIEGEDGYCGVLVWEESGPSPTTMEKHSAHTSAVREGRQEPSEIPNTKATIRRCFSDVALQMARLPLSSPRTTAVNNSMEPCRTESLCAPPRSESPSLLKDGAAGEAMCLVSKHLPKYDSARSTREEITANASSVIVLSESVSTQVSLASPSSEVSTVLHATEGTSEYSTIIEHECVSKEDTRCCNTRSGTKAELFVCENCLTSANCAHDEVGADRKQLPGREAELPEYDEREIAAQQDHVHQSTQCDCTQEEKIFSHVEESGNSVQQRHDRESKHAKEGIRKDRSCVNVSEENKDLSQHRSRLHEDSGCRGIWLKRSATEDVVETTSKRYIAAMLHRLRECRARELELDPTMDTKGRSIVEKSVACSAGRTGITGQHSLPHNNGRSWLVNNEGVLDGWLVRGGTSMLETDTENSKTLSTGSQEDPSPAAKDELRVTARLADTSQFLQHVSSIGVGSVCELNVLLTHNSLMDDVWIRVRVGTSRPSRSASQEEEEARKSSTAARNNNLSSGIVDVQQLRGELGRGDGAGRGESEVEDDAVNFVESLMTCFQFAEVVGGDAKRDGARGHNQ